MQINSFKFLLSTLFLSVVVSGYPFHSSQQDSNGLGNQARICSAESRFEKLYNLLIPVPSTIQELNYTQSLQLAISVTNLYFQSHCQNLVFADMFADVSLVSIDFYTELKIVSEMDDNMRLIRFALRKGGDGLYDFLVKYGSLVYASSKVSFDFFDYRLAPIQSLICAQLIPIANAAAKIRKSNNTDAKNLWASSVDLCSSGLNKVQRGFLNVVEAATIDTKCKGKAPTLRRCFMTIKFTSVDLFHRTIDCNQKCTNRCNHADMESNYLINPGLTVQAKVFNNDGHCMMREKFGLFDDFNSIEAVECADQQNYFYVEHHFIDKKWYARRRPGGPLFSYIERSRTSNGIGLYDNGAGDNIFIFTNDSSKILSDKQGVICSGSKFYNRCQLKVPSPYGPCYDTN